MCTGRLKSLINDDAVNSWALILGVVRLATNGLGVVRFSAKHSV